jgi:tRNA threonylcarbamoyladenosine biosynthesis protein TsaE
MKKKEFKKKDLKNIGEDIINNAKSNKKDKATILAFSGDLGAGKTTLTKEIAKTFKVKKEIISPTFVIMKIYDIEDDTWKKLIHIDAYRFEKGEDLSVLGWSDIIENKENIIIIEWPEMVENHIPDWAIKISLSHKDEDTRLIEY